MAHSVAPQLPALLDACKGYHLHSPDGWITTAGFMTACKRAGLTLSRAEYLALERALTKDTMGRINYYQLQVRCSLYEGLGIGVCVDCADGRPLKVTEPLCERGGSQVPL